mmetsp:Transcript_43112/g.77445  ORF Transcript_43112/g.77445 Transcript_43112/m.77445 type:complete len:261 (+) Transcript_43112:60-842(+)
MLSLHSTVILLLGAGVLPVAEAAQGAVKLDNMTFDKMLSVPGLTLLAKIDKAYPYGDKEETFKELCKLSYHVKDFLIGEIPVQEYGDKENEDLQKRFEVRTDEFPVYLLFKKGAAEPPIRFEGFPDPNAKKPASWDDEEDGPWEPPFRTDVTPENFVTWLRMKGVKMPYGGTILDMDEVAKKFMKGFKDDDFAEAKKAGRRRVQRRCQGCRLHQDHAEDKGEGCCLCGDGDGQSKEVDGRKDHASETDGIGHQGQDFADF